MQRDSPAGEYPTAQPLFFPAAPSLATGETANWWSDRFVQLWLLVIPITSILVLPGVQGAIPATLCAGIAVLTLVARRSRQSDRTLLGILGIGLLFGIFQCAAAMGASHVPQTLLTPLTFTNEYRLDGGFLSTVATQSAYLLVGLVIALYVRSFAEPRWYRWLFAGPVLLVAYGLYEWLYFLAFQESGDFLTNRTFSEDVAFDSDGARGSDVQIYELLGLRLLRLKSLTGEPSTFALTVLPYFFLALSLGRRWIAAFLLLGLMLSVSSTALLLLPVGLAMWLCLRRQGWRMSRSEWLGIFLVLVAGWVSLAVLPVQGIIDHVVADLQMKLSGQGVSGEERLESHRHSINFFLNSPPAVQLLGLGFGVARPLSFFDWLLVNCGLIGTIAWLGVFLWPIVRLRSHDQVSVGLRIALFVILAAMLASVPEFSYPTIWLFLGLAYAQLAGESHDP